MTEVVREKTNVWLYEKLKEKKLINEGGNPHSEQVLELIVEVEPDYTAEVADRLEALDIEVHRGRISWGRYIPIVAIVKAIPKIQDLPRVVKVHYSMPRYPYFLPFLVEKTDPLLGKIRISEIEVPYGPLEAGIRVLPLLPFGGPLGLLTGPSQTDVEMWPTGETRKIIFQFPLLGFLLCIEPTV